MRAKRFTFLNAFHHVMNRGLNGINIFPQHDDKLFFLSLLYKKSKLFKIRIFAFCIMDNHYHLVLQNSSNRMSDFMRQLNSEYALYYRKKYGGRGYVFQDRFKSTLIQDDSYLFTAILYTLLNPVCAKITDTPYNYQYSSINEYFNNNRVNKITDIEYVEGLFQNKKNLLTNLFEMPDIKSVEKNSKFGKIMGNEIYAEEIEKEIEKREKEEEIHPNLRSTDYRYKSVEEVINKFENKIGKSIGEIDTRHISGKKLRMKLLKVLREEAGLKYKEINVISIFRKLKLYSLSHLYLLSIS